MSAAPYLCSNKEIERLAHALIGLGLVRVERDRKHPIVISVASNRRVAMPMTPSDVRAYDNFVTGMGHLLGLKKRELLGLAFPRKGKKAAEVAAPDPDLTRT
jgi:hypothetical protein